MDKAPSLLTPSLASAGDGIPKIPPQLILIVQEQVRFMMEKTVLQVPQSR